MDIKRIIKRIEKESYEYVESNKAADDWLMIPKSLLSQIIADEVANIQEQFERTK